VFFDDARGGWVGQASVGINPSTGKRRRVKVRAATKREAHRRLHERIAELERTSGAVTPNTVGELVAKWLTREAPKTMSPRTLTMVRTMVTNHILPSLGQMRVSELRAEHVEQLLDTKARQGFARSSLVKLHSYLGQAYDAGMRRRLVSWNPARVAVIPPASSKRQGRALTPADVRGLLNSAGADRLGVWVTVAVTLGLRPGEVSGLKWDAIDLDGGRMVVFRSLGWVGGKPELKAPKSKRSRTLAMPSRTVKALRRHRQYQLEERLIAGTRWSATWEGLVFVTPNGLPLDPANVRRVVKRIASAAGIDGVVTPYDLRHTATSVLSATGVAPELLADLLGHVDTRMVFRHYRHPVTPTIDVAADHIERAIKA
jgi:integrase